MKGVKGYTHVYRARPVGDRTQWTPLMHTLMKNAADPMDGAPFSAPVIGTRLTKRVMSPTFTVQGVTVTVHTRYDKADRAIHSIAVGGSSSVLSEPTVPHD